MMLSAFPLLLAGLAEAIAPSIALADYTKMASGWVLDGKDLPREYRVQLRTLQPGDRLQAIAFLRRAGLLNEEPWTLGELLREAEAEAKPKP